MTTAQPTQRVPLLDLKAQHAALREELRAAFDRVLDSQQFVLGEDVRLLESELARYTRARYAVGTRWSARPVPPDWAGTDGRAERRPPRS